MTTENRAFWYINGEPCTGKWIDMDIIDDTGEVLSELAEAKIIPTNEDGEPEYGGDLLVADAEGLAKEFTGSHGCFEFTEFVECRDHTADDEAKAAYMAIYSDWDSDRFDESYCGEWSSDRDFAESYIEDTGMLADMSDSLSMYFDYDSFARDFMMDHGEDNGHYFRSY